MYIVSVTRWGLQCQQLAVGTLFLRLSGIQSVAFVGIACQFPPKLPNKYLPGKPYVTLCFALNPM